MGERTGPADPEALKAVNQYQSHNPSPEGVGPTTSAVKNPFVLREMSHFALSSQGRCGSRNTALGMFYPREMKLKKTSPAY